MWIVAGGLQLQPFMFTKGFSEDVLGTAATSQPEPLGAAIRLGERVVAAHPGGWNWAFALIELAIGAGMLFGGRGRLAALSCLGCLGWGAGIWLVGEGAGGMLTGHAALSTGAPGAALLYVALTIAAWPSGAGAEPEPPPSRRMLAGTWLGVWLIGAVLAALPAQWGASKLSAQSAMGWMMSPSWAAGPSLALTRWLGSLPTLAAEVLSGCVVAIYVMVALAVRHFGAARQVLILAGAALALAMWMFGQGFGGVSTGTATDVGTGPLIVILALALLVEHKPAAVSRNQHAVDTIANSVLSGTVTVSVGQNASVTDVASGIDR